MERSMDHHRHIPAKPIISAAEKAITLLRATSDFRQPKFNAGNIRHVKKAVRGRPPRAEEAAERRLTIRWSDKEYRLVERAADSSGNSLAAWARTVLLDAAKRGPAPRRDGPPDTDGRSVPTSDSS